MINFLRELRRRNVFKVGVAYAIVAWLLIQIIVIVETPLHLPNWVDTLTIIFLITGFPITLIITWAFELTPEGVKRTHDVLPTESIANTTGRKIDFVIIGLMAAAIIFLVVDNYVWVEEEPAPVVNTGTAMKTEMITDTPVKTDNKSIAVLPFVNMSDDKDYFSDGLSEEILNLLAKHRELKVAGRTSSFAFKGRNEDLREIGEALDVATVLEGSVRKSGVKLRITAQLINVADGYHIWSETYDREMTDIFDMQDDIAAKIMAALEIHLGTAKPDHKRPTDNMVAYEKYLAAKAIYAQDQWDSLKSINLLKEVVSLDPTFAEAWQFLAMQYWIKTGATGLPQDEAAILCFDAARKALALDPSLSIAAAMEDSANPEKNTWAGEMKMLKKHTRNTRMNLW